MLLNIDDVRDFDAYLGRRISQYQAKLADWLAPHRLTLEKIDVHRVLIPMKGVYTPGRQALPAMSWEFVEITTREGLVGTGEWSIGIDEAARNCIEMLRHNPNKNLLDPDLEEPLFMAWWDLVGQVLQRPLHLLWAELFERPGSVPEAVPMAAYTWQRFPDAQGRDAVTYENWPEHAAKWAKTGFPSIKVSMTSYEPSDHIDLVHRIREAVGPETAIRIDAHGTWNFQEARRILRELEDCNLEYTEQPINALLPQCFYPKTSGAPERDSAEGGYQAEYYFRKMTQLRDYVSIPLSCHWWTPPLIHRPGASVISNQWEVNWYMLQRYEAADISAPDIGLGVWGLWRMAQLARFLGMHITVHSNFELCLQLAFRSAMMASLVYDTESAGLYMGDTPRRCHPIDNETIQVSDDVIEGGPFDWTGGHLRLSSAHGHGLKLDPERLAKYRYSDAAVQPHQAHAKRIYSNYLLDRPRRSSQAGWPKHQPAERFDRHSFPYRVDHILGSENSQDVDLELNR